MKKITLVIMCLFGTAFAQTESLVEALGPAEATRTTVQAMRGTMSTCLVTVVTSRTVRVYRRQGGRLVFLYAYPHADVSTSQDACT